MTIQPVGAIFDPPARLTLPNVDGYSPGQEVEMFSYSHTLEEFLTVGWGTVSEDGATIRSNEYVGVVESGWHCGAAPSEDCCTCQTNNPCYYCPSDACKPKLDPDRVRPNQKPDDCKTIYCDGDTKFANETAAVKASKDKEGDCSTPFCNSETEGIDTQNDAADLNKNSPNWECEKCEDESQVPDPDKKGACQDECGACVDGVCDIPEDNYDKPRSKQYPDDCRTLLCVDPDEFADETENLTDSPGDCAEPFCDPKTKDPSKRNDPDDLPQTKDAECQICVNMEPDANPAAQGAPCNDECGICTGKTCEIDEKKEKKTQNSPNDCRTDMCDGSWKEANEDPGNICEICERGHDVPDEDMHNRPTGDDPIPNDCKVEGCFVGVKVPTLLYSGSDKPLDGGWCRDPACSEADGPYQQFNPNDKPPETAGDCALNICEQEGDAISLATTFYESDYLSTIQDIPGDCRAPGCEPNANRTGGTPAADAVFDSGDRPKDADGTLNECKLCSNGGILNITSSSMPGNECMACANGEESPKNGAIEGESCSYCNNGSKANHEKGTAIAGEPCLMCNGVGGKTAGPNGTGCDDGNACTTNDQCSNGTCTGTPIPDCDPSDPGDGGGDPPPDGEEPPDDGDGGGGGEPPDLNDRFHIKLLDARTNRGGGLSEIDEEMEIEQRTIYINEDGEMPEITAKLHVPAESEAPEEINWVFSSRHPRRPAQVYYNSKNEVVGHRLCSDENLDDRVFASNTAGALWDIYTYATLEQSRNAFGAANLWDEENESHLEPWASVNVNFQWWLRFRILGKNPSRSDVRYFMDYEAGVAKPFDEVWQIALHESGNSGESWVSQFNKAKVAGSFYDGAPNFGAPDGWGIMQIDRSCKWNDANDNGIRESTEALTGRDGTVPTDVVWSWKQNVREGLRVAKEKLDSSASVYGRVLDAHLRYYREKEGWEESDFIPLPNEVVAIDIGGTTIQANPIEVCAVQLYNGLGKVPVSSVPQQGDPDFKYQYCFRYEPDYDKADNSITWRDVWIFQKNQNDYVKHVYSK